MEETLWGLEKTCIFNVKIWSKSYKNKVGHFNIFNLLCFFADKLTATCRFVLAYFLFQEFDHAFCRFRPFQLMHDIKLAGLLGERSPRRRGEGG